MSKELENIRERILSSIISHRNYAIFYNLFDKFIKFITVIFSASATTDTLKIFIYADSLTKYNAIIMFIITILTSFQLVYSLESRSIQHESIKNNLHSLLSEVESNSTATMLELQLWNAKYFDILSSAPPISENSEKISASKARKMLNIKD